MILDIQNGDKLIKSGQVDSGLDLIYDSVDRYLRAGRFSEISDQLKSVDLGSLHAHTLLAILISTLPARSRLQGIHEIRLKTEAILKVRNEWKDNFDLFKGL